MIESLKWDSEFFGYKIGKIENPNMESFQELANSEFQLIYVFSVKEIACIEQYLVDKKATFIQDLNFYESFGLEDLIIMEFNPDNHSYSELLQLSYESGVFSRFYTDKNFRKNEFEKLYKKWIDNSLNGDSNHKIFVAEDIDKNLLGFITLGKRTEKLNDIGLLAVSPKARGKKVGTKLIEFSKDLSRKNNIYQLQVVTQLQNIPATKLYESTGFKLKELNYIYHIWNHDTI